MEVDGGRGEDAPIEEADAEEEAGPRVSTEGASLDPVAIMSVKVLFLAQGPLVELIE